MKRANSQGERNGLRTAAALVVMATVAGGCSSASLTPAFDLPESPDVEDAPWPLLADAPPPVSATGENNIDSITGKGGEIQSELGPEAQALIERDAALRAESVVDPSLYARAERLRRRARALHAAE